ncbi:MAG: FAD-binding oxidoreductase [Candidatus Desulfatibia sp.]|uniref:FAD-binding oxidoreductase n=1 Tax=Candidatus Desulfatibia sp. TaxID=3101189 RepID=UPI002F2D3F0C
MHSHDLAPVPASVKRNYNNMPSAVVKPISAEELEKLVKAAMRMKTCLIPKGRGTSYLWGSVPVVGGIIVDMTEMNEIYNLSPEKLWVEAGAGTTWQQVEEYLGKRGYTLCVYPTSMPSATVGGWMASAGSGLGSGGYGVGSLMYGPVGKNIAAIEAVTGTGKKLTLFDNEDIADFIGTDGITGFIIKAKIKIRKKPEAAKQVLVTAKNEESLQELAERLFALKTAYYAQFEDAGLIKCKLSINLHTPEIEGGFLLLAVFEGSKNEVSGDAGQFEVAASNLGGKVLSESDAAKEWEERCYPMRIKRGGPSVIAGEFTVPANRLSSALNDVSSELPGGSAKCGIHGVVVGKPDVLVMPQVLSDERKGFGFLASLSYSKRFNDIAPRHGGKPYGVGHLGAFNARLVHGVEGLRRLKTLKKKYDPFNVINPGKGIEHRTRFGFSVPPALFNLTMFGLGLFRRGAV